VSEPLPGLPEPGDALSGDSLELRRSQDLTPAERVLRRRNRRLLALVAIPGILLGVGALAASLLAGSGSAGPRPLSVPAGYQAVNDTVFAYSVPSSWSKNLAYSDDTGDLDFSGVDGWAGEYLAARGTPPGADNAAPASFADFGQNRPTPFQIGPGIPVTIPGATVAYRHTVSRPSGFRGVAVDAWQSSTGAELWILVDAPPAVASTILQSLRGS